MLYERDYRELTDDEIKIWEDVEFEFNKTGKIIKPQALVKYYNDLPMAVLHYKQLFPNNYLDLDSLKKHQRSKVVSEKFKQLIDTTSTERDILNFIRDEKAYHIIASILNGYRFGHHQAFLFREFELPPNYVVDFLLVGKNSGGYEFVFVELESPQGKIVNKDGEFGSVIRKGIKQINDWDSWLERNYYSLRLVFEKYLGKMEQLPREFFELEKSRIHYVVVAGRRSDFTEKTYQLRRKLLKSNSVLLLHYDNLLNIDILMTQNLLP